ncbi:EAL domain-containing protein [Primorskyibacter sp. 2E107]
MADIGAQDMNLCGQKLDTFLTEESAAVWATEVISRLPLRGRLENLRLNFKRSDGTGFLALASIDQLDTGLVEAVFKNVDFLIDLEDRLRQKRERLGALLEGTGAALWAFNAQTKELIVNDRWAQIAGYETEELAPITVETWRALCHPADLERERSTIEAHLSGALESYEGRVRLRHRNGGLVWVRITGKVTSRDTDGQAEWLHGIFVDITEDIAGRTMLRRAEETLDKASRLAGFGGWEVDMRDGAIYWSPETCRLHNVAADFVPQSLDEAYAFYPEAARETLRAAVDQAIENGTGWDLELPFVPRGRSQIWIRTIAEVVTENGTPVRLSGAVQDITDRKLQRDALARTTERLSLAVRFGGIGVWEADIVTGDLRFDARMTEHFSSNGTAPATLRDWLAILEDESGTILHAAINRTLRHGEPLDVPVLTRHQGQTKAFRVTAQIHEQPGEDAARLIGACWDQTPMHTMTSRLERERSWLQTSLRSIGDGVITADPAGRVLWMNPVAEQLTGIKLDKARGRVSDTVFRVINEVTGKSCDDPIAACLSTRANVNLEANATLVNPQGKLIAVDDSVAPILSDGGDLLGAIMVFRDVSEQRETKRRMEEQATLDHTTGLPNRRWFTASLSSLLSQSPGTREDNFLIFCDLDVFKQINDIHGHAMGDIILRDTARILQTSFADARVVARLGGDEFALIATADDENALRRRLEAVCTDVAHLAEHHALAPSARLLGMSIGVVSLTRSFGNRGEAMRAADAACYRAKQLGRGQVVFAGELSEAELIVRSADDDVYALLETAIAEDKVDVHFQQVRSLTGTDFPMVELLARLTSHDGRPIGAGDFIPVAERSGLISGLDLWMLRKAVTLVADCPFGRATTMCVNVSGASVGDEAFCRAALDILSEAGPKVAAHLCLEITETVALHNTERVALFARHVREKGAKIALDDFGAGMSSIRHLHVLTVDYLKLDGAFVRDICTSRVTRLALSCFVDLAHEIGAKTIAESVETDEVLNDIRALGVDYVQGYLLHRPEPLPTAS